MSELRVVFMCPRRGHPFAEIVAEASDGGVALVAIIKNSAYTDIGPRPGTVRVKRSGVEQRLRIGHQTEHWQITVVCACGTRRSLGCCQCETQLREWEKYNRPNVRRVVLDTTI